MRKLLYIAIILVATAGACYAWGFFGHKRINRMAVFTLPPSMIGFYKNHIEFITEHAVDPDRRRYANAEEAPRHYIDLDHYGEHPFDSVPKWWKRAVEKYSEDTLKAYGIVPWHVDLMEYKLTEAFKKMDVDLILHYSADIGHYIADAHVPLHTTENYNGQLTGQRGIHGFWESRIPEMEAEDYDYLTGRAHYVEKPIDEIWKAVKASFAAKDSVLFMEAELNKSFSPDQKYSLENKGATTVKTYSEAYTKAYSKMLNGMVERRMHAAIALVGSFWYTAWVNAGQPDLYKLENKDVSDSLKLAMKKEDELLKQVTPKDIKGHDE